MNFYFVDFEASSLDSGSFPVEVAWVNEIGRGESYLIRPEPTWTNWSAQSEEIHGISHPLLLQQGKPADWVAHRALTVLRGATLVSDNPAFDVYWLSMLFKVIWDKTEIEMVDLQSVIGQALQRLLILNEAEVDSPVLLHIFSRWFACHLREDAMTYQAATPNSPAMNCA